MIWADPLATGAVVGLILWVALEDVLKDNGRDLRSPDRRDQPDQDPRPHP